jgi:hypothetical protein
MARSLRRRTGPQPRTLPDRESISIFPQAKLGQGNYIAIYSGAYFNGSAWKTDSTNYFSISSVSAITSRYSVITASTGLTVQQAYFIDNKIDDGLPQTGRVTAQYWTWPLNNYYPTWAAGPAAGPSGTTATTGSATTCFDNGNSAGATQQYSMGQNSGSGINCALSIRMQAGD